MQYVLQNIINNLYVGKSTFFFLNFLSIITFYTFLKSHYKNV